MASNTERIDKMKRLSVKELEKIAESGSLSASAAKKELSSRNKSANTAS